LSSCEPPSITQPLLSVDLLISPLSVSLDRRTAYSRLQLRIQYTENYPQDIPIIELTSPSLPAPLLRNKEKETQEVAKGSLGQSQFSAIYESLYQFIQTNLFVSCWKEVKQVMTLCEGKGPLSAEEKEGLLKFRLREGNYRQPFNIRVPFLYPEEGVEIEFLPQSNFPSEIQQIYLSQAQEIARRCVAGIPSDHDTEVCLSLCHFPAQDMNRLDILLDYKLQHVQQNLTLLTSLSPQQISKI
jgi:hypothetical protein